MRELSLDSVVEAEPPPAPPGGYVRAQRWDGSPGRAVVQVPNGWWVVTDGQMRYWLQTHVNGAARLRLVPIELWGSEPGPDAGTPCAMFFPGVDRSVLAVHLPVDLWWRAGRAPSMILLPARPILLLLEMADAAPWPMAFLGVPGDSARLCDADAPRGRSGRHERLHRLPTRTDRPQRGQAGGQLRVRSAGPSRAGGGTVWTTRRPTRD
jgi:hypothetical protein